MPVWGYCSTGKLAITMRLPRETKKLKGFPGALSMITVDFLINPDNKITNEWCLSALPTSNTETTPAVDRPGLILM